MAGAGVGSIEGGRGSKSIGLGLGTLAKPIFPNQFVGIEYIPAKKL
jgi:hypothetical protein